MEHPENPAPAPPAPAAPVSPVDRAFAAIVSALAAEDPRFVRRVSTSGPGGLGRGGLMIVVGLLTTVLLGILPLAVGLQSGVVALLVAGATGCTVLPVAVPLAVRGLLRRARPMLG